MNEIDLEKTIHAMRQAAPMLAEAKANRVYLEQYRKSLKAILFSEAPDGTIADKENYAYAHPKYLEVLDGLREAVKEEEELKWRMAAAQLKVEVWRTQRADRRTEKANYGA